MTVDAYTLQADIKGQVLTPGCKGYEESLKRWAGNTEKKAGFVVYTESSQDVSKTV